MVMLAIYGTSDYSNIYQEMSKYEWFRAKYYEGGVWPRNIGKMDILGVLPHRSLNDSVKQNIFNTVKQIKTGMGLSRS